jgi:hypothetical protein
VCAPAGPPSFPSCSTRGTMCGSCVATTNTAFSNVCLGLCARGCENACVQSFVRGGGCSQDADCPFGQACVQVLLNCETQLCGGPEPGVCAAPCP